MKIILTPTPSSLKKGALAGLLALFPFSASFAAISSEGAGEIAIYREAAGADVIGPNGSTAAGFLTHDFDTVDREDAGSFSLSGSDVTLNRDGHYLAIYNSRFDATPESGSEQRVEVQSYLTLGGAALLTGWSQGYIRRQQDRRETITSGLGIFEASASEVLQLRTLRSDNTTFGTVTRFPDATGLQLIKLDDVNMSFARLSRAADQPGPVDPTPVNQFLVLPHSRRERGAGQYSGRLPLPEFGIFKFGRGPTGILRSGLVGRGWNQVRRRSERALLQGRPGSSPIRQHLRLRGGRAFGSFNRRNGLIGARKRWNESG